MKPHLTRWFDHKDALGYLYYGLDLRFDLHEEDMHIVLSYIQPEMEKQLGREVPLEEVLFACLTSGIHKAYEEVTGKPFKLRMDRPKKKA